jgi:tetratricopeptide (TPR) repeat protein
MRKEVQASTGLLQMGRLMIIMGQFNKAEEIYLILLQTTSDDNREDLALIHYQLGCISYQKSDLSNALSHYKQSFDLDLTYLSSDDPQLSSTYSNIQTILYQQDDLDDALKHFERALNIDLHALEPDQRNIATHYTTILVQY